MSNLIQNPTFEEGLNYWNANNVTLSTGNPFVGTASARLGPGVANISQDVLLEESESTLQLSFAIASPSVADPGTIIITVTWLDGYRREIGTGLTMMVGSATTAVQPLWVTRVNTTTLAPNNAVAARVNFSKSAGMGDYNCIDLDLVVLQTMYVPGFVDSTARNREL
jgi:hypothetical protein